MDTPTKFVANKSLIIRGVTYRPGDQFDPSTVPEQKFNQFLRHRMIRPDYQGEPEVQPT